MGGNVMLTEIDLSKGVMEMKPIDVLTDHTACHAMWNGIKSGKIFKGATMESLFEFHLKLVEFFKMNKIKHMKFDDLDEV